MKKYILITTILIASLLPFLAQAQNCGTITASGPTTFCQGGSVTLTAPLATAYLWSSGQTTRAIVVNASGTFTVHVTNSGGCTGNTTPTTVTVDPLPLAAITANGPVTFCQGGTVTLSATANTSYKWSSGQTTQAITVGVSNGYTVTVTNANGCSATSKTEVVTVNPLPSALITPTGKSFCQEALLNVPLDSLYKWSTGATTNSISVFSSGIYTVTVTNSNKCTASSADTITVSPFPSDTISPSGPVTFCQGSSAILSVPAGNTYHWSTGQTTDSITVTTGGSYVVTVTGSTGCSVVSGTTLVTVSPSPTAVITPGGNVFCNSTVLTVSADSLYKWSTGAITRSITALNSGIYSVTITNSDHCTSSTSDTITISGPIRDTISANGPLTFCQGGSVILSVPAGSSYNWSTGATTNSITVTISGNYAVTVTNGTGCSAASGTTLVTVNPNPAAVITPAGNVFCNSTVLTVSADSLYKWSTGAITRSITALNSGIYSVTITSDNRCTASTNDTITISSNIRDTISANGPLTFCQGGSVILSVPVGNSYQWSTGQTTNSITVSTSGSYSVIVTNSTGCSAVSGTTVVTVNPLPTAVVTPAGKTFCASVVLTVSVDSLYKWNTGAITRSITATSSGIYSVTVTNDSHCTASVSDTINVSPLRDTISASGPLTFCQGGSVILSVPPGNSYQWSTGQTTNSITVSASGSYSVIVSSPTCTAESNTVVVTVFPIPTATVTANGPLTFCKDDSVTLTVAPGNAGGPFFFAWSTLQSTPSINVKSSGNYSVTVVNTDGCSTVSGITVVTVDSTVRPVITPGTKVFCGSATLTVTADSSYRWSTGAITQSITTNSSGSYTVTVFDDNRCSASAVDTITVSTGPIIIVTNNGPLTFCQGDSVILSANSYSPDVSYKWSNGQNTPSIIVTSSGSYSVTATDSFGCSGTAGPIIVTVNPAPTPVISPGTKIFCGSATLTVTPDSLYKWNTGATSQSITVNSSGNYTVTVSDDNKCTASATDSIIVNNAPHITIVPNGPTNFCKGDSVNLSVASLINSLADTANTYNWNTGQTTASITAFTSGNYSVTLTDADGCSSSASINVTVHQLNNIIIIDSTTTLCENDSLHLTVNGGLIYEWSTQQTTPAITIDAPGLYSVIIVDSFRCITRDTIVIPQLVNCCNKFFPQFTMNDSVFCSTDTICYNIIGGTDFEISIDSVGGTRVFYISGAHPFSVCGPIPASMSASGYYTATAVIYLRDSSGAILCDDTIRKTIYIKPSCSCACMCAETCPYLHADFTYTVYQGYMVLRDSSIGNPTFDEWFIGGQTFVTGPGDSLVYTFQHSGNYTICLTIHHLVYGSDLCCLADTCKTIYGPVDTCSILHLNAGFTFSSNFEQQLTYSFTPTSQNAVPNVVIWNFGDGTTLTTDSSGPVSHTYATNGTYQVCVNQVWLLPGNYCCIDSQCATLTAGLIQLAVKTSPNPFKGSLSVQLAVPENGMIQLELYDVMGKLQTVLVNSEYYARGSYTMEFDLSSLAPGIYSYRYKTTQGMESGKLIKE